MDGASVTYTERQLEGGIYLYPTQAIITCPVGDVPNGPAIVSCQENGGWNAEVTHCQGIGETLKFV